MTLLSISSTSPCEPRRRRRTLADMVALRRQRRRLSQLDDAALRDIGLTRTEAEAEAQRPVWDVPGHWIK